MLQKPEKPKNYNRDQIIIAVVAFAIMALLLILKSSNFFVVLVPCWFFIITYGIRFKEYEAQKSQYKKELVNQKLQASQHQQSTASSSVSENIAKYEELQKEKRANTKWWQFWV